MNEDPNLLSFEWNIYQIIDSFEYAGMSWENTKSVWENELLMKKV